MKTAEEFSKDFIDFNEVSLDEYNEKQINFDYQLAMIGFAKMHVTEALKRASDNVCAKTNQTIEYIEKQSILNAYPLDQIK